MFVSIFISRLWQVPYCVPVLKTSQRWVQVEEHHSVIYDTESRVISFYYYYLFIFCLKTVLVNAKESDLNRVLSKLLDARS